MTLKAYLALALIAIAALGAGYGLWQRSTVKELQSLNQALKNRVAGLESSERALQDSAEAADRARRKALAQRDQARKELDNALQDNPDWAAGDVPQRLWDALRPKP